jgi:hypothetical protein
MASLFGGWFFKRVPDFASVEVMSTGNIVALLVEERDKLDLAIEALTGSERRRGRPSSDAHAVAADTTVATRVAPVPPASAKGKRVFTAAQRKAQAEKMKQYWAAKRKKEAKR